MFYPRVGARHPIIGVVGALQFDVIAARLATEYGLTCALEPLPHIAARWPDAWATGSRELGLPTAGTLQVTDRQGRRVLLFESDWVLRYTIERNPDVRFQASPS